MLVLLIFFFFFFKQKTAYEMRISDWSSDVCSSDLVGPRQLEERRRNLRRPRRRDLPEAPYPPRRARNLRLSLPPRRRRRRAGPDPDRLDIVRTGPRTLRRQYRDRKSTRLNSSH